MESIIPEAREVASLSEPLAALSYLPMLRPRGSLKSHRFEGVDFRKVENALSPLGALK